MKGYLRRKVTYNLGKVSRRPSHKYETESGGHSVHWMFRKDSLHTLPEVAVIIDEYGKHIVDYDEMISNPEWYVFMGATISDNRIEHRFRLIG